MATAYLHRTPGGAGNQTTWTFSTWFKRGIIPASPGMDQLFAQGTDSNNYTNIGINTAGKIAMSQYTSSSGVMDLDTNTGYKFRDTGAWYHVVIAVDTTQTTNTDRVKLYVNGNLESWLGSTSYPAEDLVTWVNGTTQMSVGYNAAQATGYWTGNMAHTHLIDGTQYAASDFGEFDATSGIWVAKTGPSVTYGTNGFFLKYASGAITTDSSGNGNTMTQVGTITTTKDTPDNNFCLPNALSKGSTVVLSNGNTTIAKDSGWLSCMGNFGMDTGKWYWEQKVAAVGNANAGITMSKQDGTSHSSVDATRIMYGSDGNVYNEQGSTTATGTTFTTGDIISVALDCAGDTIKFYKNDVLIHTETETDISDNEWCPAWGMSSGTWDTNFGNGYFATTAVTSAVADGNGEGQFEYAPPSGYLALCTNNLGSDS